MLRLAQISLGTVGMLDRRLRARRGAVVIPVRISIRSGHGRTEPDVSRLLRHRVQILRMPRILRAAGPEADARDLADCDSRRKDATI